MPETYETQPIPFAVGSYKSASPVVSAQRMVNAYAEIQKQSLTPRSIAPIFGSPGLTQFATAGSGPIRALLFFEPNEKVYAVSGSSFYEIDSAGVATLIGSGIQPGSGFLSMAENGTSIQVVDGTSGFYYTPGSGAFAPITDVDFESAFTTNFILSYFMHDWSGTNKFFSSDSNSPSSYDALFNSTADTQSDRVLATFNFHQQLYVAGRKSIEIWQFVPGSSSFPWQRFPGASVQIGIAGRFGCIVHKESIFLVGSDLLLYRLDGANPVVISDPAVATEWQSYTTTSDVFMMAMTYGIQEWIIITFPTENKTWVFDATSGLFHERESLDSGAVSLGRWRGSCYCRAFGKHLVGDAYDNKIGYLDKDAFDEYGNTMQFKVVSPILHNDGQEVTLSALELIMQTGVGLTTGQGVDPKVMLRWSDDGGQTWAAHQPVRDLGALGEYQTRVRWTEMGSFRNRCFEVVISDPVRRVLVSAIPKLEGNLSYA